MVKLGLIIGNRGFFPDHLCDSGRKAVIETLKGEGIEIIALGTDATKFGAVETLADARKCAVLFKKHGDEIDGVLVTLPNFGDEKGVANALKFSGLNVPVMVHAFEDDAQKMTLQDRRDSFCGKISVCNNFRQYGIKYSLTQRHTDGPNSDTFKKDLRKFSAVCRVVRDLRKARIGAIGTRPAAFNTVRYSEKLFEASGISVEPIDLFDLMGRVEQLTDKDSKVKQKLETIRNYVDTKGAPDESLIKLARLGAGIDDWMEENELSATAIQCWTAIQEFYGISPCVLMSMMSNKLMASACETDISGLVGMYALQSASGSPSALVDWNNNYGQDDNKGVIFHCSNFPVEVFESGGKLDLQDIIGKSVGNEKTYGTVIGRVRPGNFTYCRVSTDDVNGRVVSYLGQGRFTDDKIETFGGYGVVEVPNFQKLLAYICDNGFEHHVVVNFSEVADAVEEALSKYMGWGVYHHEG
ncbi:MAG: L-fucose/L-arabinose isomerase family protein [Planctomycetota bacterium]|nr:MAG: L-fucose/L-arabinose isomerase family protein [Planctomycetota bacterium]